MDMLKKDINEFLDVLGSSEPVPGGGGASALAGALAAALGLMVGSLTVGKKKYADVEDEIKAMMAEMTELKDNLAACINKDAEMFMPLAEAYRMPKDAPDRDEVMERCLADAAATPLEIMELSAKAIELLEGFAAKGSKLAVSDAATGAALAKGAMMGAAVNVRVNTRLMKNRARAVELDGRADALIADFESRADAVFNNYYK